MANLGPTKVGDHWGLASAGYWRLLALWYCTQAIALNVADEPVPLTVYTFVTKVLALFQVPGRGQRRSPD